MIPASVRIFVCTKPYDMRCSYDTLALAAQQVVGEDPRSGALFVFSNKQYRRLYMETLERCALPPELPRVVVEVLPPEVQREGLDFERIGEEVSEVVEHRSAALVVVRIVRPKFVRRRDAATPRRRRAGRGR